MTIAPRKVSEMERTQPTTIKVLCEDNAEYDIYLWSFNHKDSELRAVVEDHLSRLYEEDEETGVTYEFGEMIEDLAKLGIYQLEFETAQGRI